MKKLISIILLLATIISLTACASEEATVTEETTTTTGETTTQETTTELTDVTVILDYVANTNHTGMFVALEKGYYEEVGLNVEIIEPTEGATATLIAVGKGDFGISYQEDVTVAKASEEPLPIKAIATIIQNNTSGFVSYEGKGITSPADFEGKTYAGWGGPGEAAVLEAVMTQAGADFSKLNMVISDGSGLESLEKDVDIKWFYEGWDSINAQMEEFPLNYMALKDLDERLNYYTPVIITNNDMIDSSPETVSAFLSATEKGYMDAISQPAESAEILAKYAPTYDIEFLTLSQEYLADKYMEGTQEWGSMKAEVWDNYTEFLLEYNVITETVDSAECFTNDFLNN